VTRHPSIQARIPPTRGAGRAQKRGDATHTAIVEETIQCVIDEGFAAASAQHIAERAGVTWGVIQYHFGDRNGLLGAVVTSGYNAFRASIDAVDVPDGDVRQGVVAVVDAAWAVFSTPEARASLEILICTRTTRGPARMTELEEMAKTMFRLGARIVGAEPDERRLGRDIGQVLWATLRGLVLAQMVTREPLDSTRERATLTDLIVAYLQLQGDG
jgi:TetR/AcrR family transcriptional regulator, regulator of cefoperazone and chloramphenicol sensitivity